MKFAQTKAVIPVLLLCSLFLVALAACGPAPATPDAATDTPSQQATATSPSPDDGSTEDNPDATNGEGEEAYPPPAPTAAVSDGPYPPPTVAIPTPVTSYPEPEPVNTPENGVAFAFERPIGPGDTVIRGVGPAGLEVRVVNVTFMGDVMATTTVGDDGQFEVTVPALEPGVRIGLTADIEGTDLADRIVPGEGALGVPQVGYFFDTVVIVAESADS